MSILRRVLAWVFVAAGTAGVAYPGLAYGTAALRQERLSAEVRFLIGPAPGAPDTGSVAGRAPATTRPERAGPAPAVTRHVVAVRPSVGQPLGAIEIPSIGLDVVFLEGVDGDVLLSGPGHLPWTALPGSGGVSVLAAHRDLHFRNLKDVSKGDRVVLRLPQRAVAYRVVDRRVVRPDDASVTRPLGRPVLRLVTCWPPNYLGPAPDRLVVSAVPIDPPALRGPAEPRRAAPPVRPSPPASPPVVTRSFVVSPPAVPMSKLPLAGTAGAVLAALAAMAVARSRRLAWSFLPWVAGLGLVSLTLLSAWAGPALAVRAGLPAEPPPARVTRVTAAPPAFPVVLGPRLTDLGGGLVRCHHAVLARPAMLSLLQAQRELGMEIPLTGSWRSRAQQALAYASKPGLAAPPGRSLHELGLAVDVRTDFLAAHPETAVILERLGWSRFDPAGEPWHFSFGRTG